MRLCWITDAHLDHVSPPILSAFLADIQAMAPTALLISGDTSTAPRLVQGLERIQQETGIPLFFILGNHDFYFSSISEVREQVRQLSRSNPRITWLPDVGYVELSPHLALVGHGGWGDGLVGDFWGSELYLNDFRLIKDLKPLRKSEWLPVLKGLGDETAAFLRRFSAEAAKRFSRVIILTHVPLFPESCLYQGRQDPNGLPFFCCYSGGQAMVEVADEYPHVNFTVLSGHTHEAAAVKICPNLEAFVQEAEYGRPRFRILEL